MIVIAPHKVLTTPAKPVEKIDKKILRLVEDMKRTLLTTDSPKGVGLAAPQIGIPLQIFIAKPTESASITVYINPRVTWKSKSLSEIQRENNGKPSLKREKKLEGCLSIPNVWGYLKRHAQVKLAFLDVSGKTHEEEFSGFMSTIVQHELDHLKGVLFTTRVLEQRQKLFRIETTDAGEEKMVEIEI